MIQPDFTPNRVRQLYFYICSPLVGAARFVAFYGLLGAVGPDATLHHQTAIEVLGALAAATLLARSGVAGTAVSVLAAMGIVLGTSPNSDVTPMQWTALSTGLSLLIAAAAFESLWSDKNAPTNQPAAQRRTVFALGVVAALGPAVSFLDPYFTWARLGPVLIAGVALLLLLAGAWRARAMLLAGSDRPAPSTELAVLVSAGWLAGAIYTVGQASVSTWPTFAGIGIGISAWIIAHFLAEQTARARIEVGVVVAVILAVFVFGLSSLGGA